MLDGISSRENESFASFILFLFDKHLRRANLVTGDGSVASDQGGTREGRNEDVKLHGNYDIRRDRFLAMGQIMFDLSVNLDHSSVTLVNWRWKGRVYKIRGTRV